MKRLMLLVVTATVLFVGGFVLYRTLRATPAQAADAPTPPLAYRDNQQFHGSSFHYCLRGQD
jgi:hypothetical protein